MIDVLTCYITLSLIQYDELMIDNECVFSISSEQYVILALLMINKKPRTQAFTKHCNLSITDGLRRMHV